MKNFRLRFHVLLTVLTAFISLASMAQTDKGVLLVNEFSNGSNGAKEWVELMVANNTTGTEDNVDIRGWLVDDNNGIFNGTTVSGAGISGGHLRFADSPYWANVPVGALIVLFNVNDFDSSNQLFMNANNDPNGVYAVNNGVDSNFIFVAVGLSPYIVVKTQTPIVGTVNRRKYCDQNLYQFSASAWNSVGLRNDSLGDGFQVRCPGCIDVPNFSDDPMFYHGASYGGQMNHVGPDSTCGEEGPWVPAPDSLGGQARAMEFFQGVTLNAIGVDSNWRLIPDSLTTPGFTNTTDNDDYRFFVTNLTHTFPICAVFQPDTTPVPGVLVVTEFSNGPSGSCEYIELLVAACASNPNATNVDIREWIVDDNNGTFAFGSGKGITSGHLKFANIDSLKKVPVGTVIVLYNNADNCYGFTKDEDYTDNDLFLPIDGTSPTNFLVKNISAGGITVKPTSSDSNYCAAAYNSVADDWNGRVSLGNDRDAVQVRCPGCQPAFYHGATYGTTMTARNRGTNNLGGPKLLNASGAQKTFIFNSNGCSPEDAGSWTNITAPAAAGGVPATAGVVDTAVYNPIIVRKTCSFPCCTQVLNKKGLEGFDTPGQMETGFVVGEAYPNPSNSIVNIEIFSTSDFTVKFMDITGREVYNKSFKANQDYSTVTIDVSSLPAGAYLFTVVSGDNSHFGKVLINK